MGFEQPGNGKPAHPFDALLEKLDQAPARAQTEVIVDGLTCRIVETSNETWNVYLDGFLYSVSKRHDGSYVANMHSNVVRADAMIAAEKTIAIKAVRALLEDSLQ